MKRPIDPCPCGAAHDWKAEVVERINRIEAWVGIPPAIYKREPTTVELDACWGPGGVCIARGSEWTHVGGGFTACSVRSIHAREGIGVRILVRYTGGGGDWPVESFVNDFVPRTPAEWSPSMVRGPFEHYRADGPPGAVTTVPNRGKRK